MSFDTLDMSWSALLKAIVFMCFYTSLALFSQSVLYTKASIVCIASIRLSVVAQGPREGSAALPGRVGG